MTSRNDWMQSKVIEHGIPGLVRLIIAACQEKHKHYLPKKSVFSAWSEVLEKHLPMMQAEVNVLLGKE